MLLSFNACDECNFKCLTSVSVAWMNWYFLSVSTMAILNIMRASFFPMQSRGPAPNGMRELWALCLLLRGMPVMK